MAQSTVLVRLKQSVKGIGHAGQLADVSFGYARNYLLPNNLADLATGKRTAEKLVKQRQQRAASANDHSAVQTIADGLAGQSITVTAAANDDGTLFAGIQAEAIAAALKTDPIFRMDPIKHTGTHQVTLDFGHDITAVIAVTVKSQQVRH